MLSGKGGTGKTLVAVNLAALARKSVYVDCDVEEPNGYLFFKPQDVLEEEVLVKIPSVNDELCDGCRKCVDFCKFNALAYVKERMIVFEEVCHSCGGCVLVCPTKALAEKERVIGKIQKGVSGHVGVNTGVLNTGEASGIPIIKRLLGDITDVSDDTVLIDCPPGSACIAMESIKDADYCVLVAEPTVFGVHNLSMVCELARVFDKPFGVILNKCLEGENPAEAYCLERNIKILGRIPFDTELGMLNSNAEIVAQASPRLEALFSDLLDTVTKEAKHETASNPKR